MKKQVQQRGRSPKKKIPVVIYKKIWFSGNSAVITIPKNVLQHKRWKKGKELEVLIYG